MAKRHTLSKIFRRLNAKIGYVLCPVVYSTLGECRLSQEHFS